MIRSRRFKFLIWVSSILVVASFAFWIFIKIDDKAFLGYGALHVPKLPETLQVIDYGTYGASDFEAQYYVSINPTEFTKLLGGRKYTVEDVTGDRFDTQPLLHSFPATKCYSSGIMKDGLVSVYVNADSSKAFIVYNVN
jgi:hypothetical protein